MAKLREALALIPAFFSVLDPKKGDGFGQTVIAMAVLGAIFYLNIVGIEVNETLQDLVNIVFGMYIGSEVRREVQRPK